MFYVSKFTTSPSESWRNCKHWMSACDTDQNGPSFYMEFWDRPLFYQKNNPLLPALAVSPNHRQRNSLWVMRQVCLMKRGNLLSKTVVLLTRLTEMSVYLVLV